jgi:hypothetical protein
MKCLFPSRNSGFTLYGANIKTSNIYEFQQSREMALGSPGQSGISMKQRDIQVSVAS